MKKRIISMLLVTLLVLAAMPLAVYAAPVNTVYANTEWELENAIDSNTKIVLSAKTYSLDYGLSVYDVENLEIVGVPGTKLVCNDIKNAVISIRWSKNVHISNVYIGHGASSTISAGGALFIWVSEDILFENCEISGGEVAGFAIEESTNVKFNNSVINDCAVYIGLVVDGSAELNNCTFMNNGYGNLYDFFDDAVYGGYGDGGYGYDYTLGLDVDCAFFAGPRSSAPLITFNNCVFQDNKNANFKCESDQFSEEPDFIKTSYNTGLTRANDCTFTNNAWQSDTPAKSPTDGADSWTKAELQLALDALIVPRSVGKAGWTKPTTRLAAAEAVVAVIERATGLLMEQIAYDKGWVLYTSGFDDTENFAVTFLKYAGIVEGIGDNKYDPNGDYTRAQTVTMIGRTAEVFFGETAKGANPFTDLPSWAAPYVGYAADNGITNGVGGGLFNSNGVLTNQETAIFCFRALKAWR